MDGRNADFAPQMEGSHADFALHMEWRHSSSDPKIAKIAIFANLKNKNKIQTTYILVVYMTYVHIFEK